MFRVGGKMTIDILFSRKFPRLKILDRYIISEVMSFVALAASALTIMLIVRTLFYSMDLLPSNSSEPQCCLHLR